MLCTRPTRSTEEIVKEMHGTKFIIDEKLDGERTQLHKKGDVFRYYSRNGNDLTHLYGPNKGEGSLTPFIYQAFNSNADEIILDGEMLAYDPTAKRILPFGTLRGAAKDTSRGASRRRPIFVAFDILHVNGLCLLDSSLTSRRKHLKELITPIKGRIELVPTYLGVTPKDLRVRLQAVVNNGGEGLVVKHPGSKYSLNTRNLDWIKVKPEYIDSMGETIDVIVVGGKFGSGARAGGVSTLVCAAIEDRLGPGPTRYTTFTSCGTGLTSGDLARIRDKHWKKDAPNSFIVTVKAAEIIESNEYGMGYTLRFPRIKQIRSDLSIDSCMRVTEILELCATTNKKRKLQGDIEPPRKKARTATPVSKPTMGPAYQAPNLANVTVTSELLNGLTFVVISDPKSKTGEDEKRDLVKRIRAYGGNIRQVLNTKQAQPLSWFIVYDGATKPYEVQSIIDKKKFDILKPRWVEDSIRLGKLAPFHEKYFFHATETRVNADEYSASVDEDQLWLPNKPAVEDDSVTEPESDEEIIRPAPPTSKAKPILVGKNMKTAQEEAPLRGELEDIDKDDKEMSADEVEADDQDNDTDVEEVNVETLFLPGKADNFDVM
ncbi:hypothetical protein NMY22_g8560 [Coprinellus aureogranulatus]|nr:hypothetical protein NMY22_g8560 [Coprinellus aureogranulatus]